MLSCCAGQLLRAMVDVTIFCPNLAQFLRVGLVQNLRAVPLLALIVLRQLGCNFASLPPPAAATMAVARDSLSHV
jgi:hypothetical protein